MVGEVPDRRRMEDRILDRDDGRCESERFEQVFPERPVEGRSGDCFDNPTGEDEAGIAVRPVLAGLVQLAHRTQPGDICSQCIVASAEVVGHEIGGIDTARVRQEVADRDASGCLSVGEPELRHVGADRRVELHAAALHQLHQQRRHPDLRHGADEEAGVGRHRHTRVAVGDAGSSRDQSFPVEDTGDGTGDAFLRGQAGDERLERPGVE
jgi:hypothetical protein